MATAIPGRARTARVHARGRLRVLAAACEVREPRADDAQARLIFSGPDGYLEPTTVLRRELYPALTRAGIPREGPTGEKRTFHSFRHTFARVALEHGAELTWLSRHLGHSSAMVTDTVYGHWGRAARKRQVKRLEGAFSV
jgi:integrase